MGLNKVQIDNPVTLREANAQLRKGNLDKAEHLYKILSESADNPVARSAIFNSQILAKRRRREKGTTTACRKDPCPSNFRPSEFSDYTLAIIVLSLNGAGHLQRLFESIAEFPPAQKYAIFLTDHASTDDTRLVVAAWESRLPLHVFWADENHTFAYSNNRWAEILTSFEFLLFLNNDIIFNDNVIDEMLRGLKDPGVGVVGVDQLEAQEESDEAAWHHCGIGFRWDAQHDFWRPFNQQRRPDCGKTKRFRDEAVVTGSVMLLRARDFLAVGGFQECYIYGYEDVDLCLEVYRKLGKRTVCLVSESVIHADGATRKRVDSSIVREQRLNNIRHLRARFGSFIGRLYRQQLWSSRGLAARPTRVAFAVTEVGEDASAGDLFTAQELGSALQCEFGWEIVYRPRGMLWYELSDIDVVIAMVDHFDPRQIRGAHPALLKVGWARNWFDRWRDRPWHDCFDFLLASSDRAGRYLQSELGQPPKILRIATNPQQFSTERRATDPSVDYLFAGSYWNADRDIVHAIAELPKALRGAVYGANWEKVPAVAPINCGFLPYHRLPEVYLDARIIIDDANHVTKPWGSVNSRVFDALAAGCMVITNSQAASDDAFDGALPVYESPSTLTEQVQALLDDPQLAERQESLRRIVLARHTYTHRAFELRQILETWSRSALRIAIKIPVPKRELGREWGDYHFASSLAVALRELGHAVRLDFLPEWNELHALQDDVVLVLRGLSEYTPEPGPINLFWLISHPDKVSDSELERYDHVFVASESHAAELDARLAVPVSVLLQCTDPRRFNLDAALEPLDVPPGILFVGNSRNQFRPIVRAAIEKGIDLEIYGTRWKQFVDSSYIKGENIDNLELPRYYNQARLVLNDHWPEMAKRGFLSNRLFDVTATGGCLLSDECQGIEYVFPDGIRIARDYEEIDEKTFEPMNRRLSARSVSLALNVQYRHGFCERARGILLTATQYFPAT